MANAALRHAPQGSLGTHWRLALPLTRFSLRVDLAQAAARAGDHLPVAVAPCHSAVRGDWSALWLGPDEQLLIGPEMSGSTYAATVSETLRGLPHSLVDISHRQAALELSGPHAAELLSTGCPLDLDPDQFAVGACTRTILAKSEIVLWRRAHAQFHVEVGRSFIPYLTGFLAAAEREFLG